jgi:hypothetical protein
MGRTQGNSQSISVSCNSYFDRTHHTPPPNFVLRCHLHPVPVQTYSFVLHVNSYSAGAIRSSLRLEPCGLHSRAVRFTSA